MQFIIIRYGYIWLRLNCGRVTHVCVSKLTIIASDNSLSPGRWHSIIWTNVGILLIRTLETNLKRTSYVFIKKDVFEDVICDMLQCFKSHRPNGFNVSVPIIWLPYHYYTATELTQMTSVQLASTKPHQSQAKYEPFSHEILTFFTEPASNAQHSSTQKSEAQFNARLMKCDIRITNSQVFNSIN